MQATFAGSKLQLGARVRSASGVEARWRRPRPATARTRRLQAGWGRRRAEWLSPTAVAVLAPGGASQSAPSGVDRCHKLGPEPRQARAGVSWPGGPPVAALSPCLPLPPPPPAAAAARA